MSVERPVFDLNASTTLEQRKIIIIYCGSQHWRCKRKLVTRRKPFEIFAFSTVPLRNYYFIQWREFHHLIEHLQMFFTFPIPYDDLVYLLAIHFFQIQQLSAYLQWSGKLISTNAFKEHHRIRIRSPLTHLHMVWRTRTPIQLSASMEFPEAFNFPVTSGNWNEYGMFT